MQSMGQIKCSLISCRGACWLRRIIYDVDSLISSQSLRFVCTRRARSRGCPAGAAGGRLFAALDGEGDGRIAGQLEAALRTLLRAGAGAEPSRWLAACTRVALAAPAVTPSPSPNPKASGAGAPAGDADVDDEEGT